VTPGEDPEPTEDPKGHIQIEKETTSTPKNGESYALDEEITYKITVKNDGNLTITDITVTDDLTGDEWTIASLAPGESKEFTAKYKVTEADILKGEVLNVATAEGKSPDPDEPEVPVTPGEDPEPTEEPKPHLTVKKETTSEPADGEAYILGEKITYKITVTNDGNLTITNITVTDELTGDKWTLASLAPGESKEFTAEHVVTEEDILAGKVVNEAAADGDNPSDKPTETEPGTTENTTEEKNPHLTIVKETTSEPANGEAYALDEKITYKITVKNDGNLTITDITVTDDLTGEKWTIDELKPGESKDFETEYTVTEADAKAGKVLNVATAEGISPDPEDPDVPVKPGEKEVPVEEITIRYWYSEGDGQIWQKSSDVDAFFTVSRDPHDKDAFSHFLSIEIDGKEVATTDYNAVSGSVKETIFKDFMESLTVGAHTIKTIFDDGEASAKFFVKAAEELPKTGDDTSLYRWIATMAMSAAALGFVLIKRKREEEEAE
jgi:LPXTG-motif cell wall-anchored protein